ncbi:MAG TPA: XRE family transcriptional regulator [Candidatus Binatia bacterium]|nr:XRE family transcriptional regulator [Candidatus Binatia bacterium]
MTKRKNTSAALQYVHRRFFAGRPKRLAELEEARASAEVGRKVYELRTKAKLTQKELAARVGTTPSVISRLEDDDYEGHSLAMLHRIATALNKRVEIRFVPLKGKRAA